MSGRVRACLLWAFIACALAYGLILLAEGFIGAIR